MKLGELIKEKRKEMKMSMREFGDLVGSTAVAINNWEKGKTIPSMKKIGKLAKVLDIDFDTLYEMYQIEERMTRTNRKEREK